jgi:hypothetical protein
MQSYEKSVTYNIVLQRIVAASRKIAVSIPGEAIQFSRLTLFFQRHYGPRID